MLGIKDIFRFRYLQVETVAFNEKFCFGGLGLYVASGFIVT